MSVSFVKRFIDNDDATSITYRKFSETPEDKYPTFSICFKGTHFHWFNDLDLYNAFELRTEQFEQMLRGKPAFRYEYEPVLRLFRRIATFVNNESYALHDEFRLKFSDWLLEVNFTALDEKHSHSFKKRGKENVIETPFNISYQTPDMICFARDSTYTSKLIRIEDSLILDRRLMESGVYANTEIQVFIHYPGHLIRSLAIPSFISSFREYQYNKTLSFKLSQSTTIRKRSECNSTMQDYDTFLTNQVINKTKCIPPYWIEIIQHKTGLNICTSQNQLQMTEKYIRDWKNVLEGSSRPCIDMYNIVGWNWLDPVGTQKADESEIKFYYQEQYYQELKYLPDFDLETFISNIGGFVGIFLGYSMMQFPELIGNSARFNKQ